VRFNGIAYEASVAGSSEFRQPFTRRGPAVDDVSRRLPDDGWAVDRDDSMRRQRPVEDDEPLRSGRWRDRARGPAAALRSDRRLLESSYFGQSQPA
jgi:hypothetical protein